MNKSSLLLSVLLVAASASFAAEPGTTPQANDTTGAKTRRNMHDVGESFKDMGRSARNVAHGIAHPRDRHHAAGAYNHGGYGGDTSADASSDASRRQRMDAAYANWQSKR